ncbi:MAG: hypothetical protein ACRDLT_04190 [Solirubrobacteraceae bacterium]
MKEFGRTPGYVGNVLAVLSDGEESMRATFEAAVGLADRANARLTLAKTCDPGRAYVWVAPFAAGAAYLPPELESPDDAARLLSRLAEQVPGSIPLTTLVLGCDPQAPILKLLRERHFGVVVADHYQLSRWRRVRRELQREQVPTVLINGGCPPENEGSFSGRFSSNGLTKDGAVDVVQVPEGRHRRRIGMRSWHARRLAGAGGER